MKRVVSRKRAIPSHTALRNESPAQNPSRRRILKVLSALGVTSVVFGRALATLAQDRPRVTDEMIKQAEWISGLEFTDEKRRLMLNGLNQNAEAFARIRAVELDNSVAPALFFFTAPARIEKKLAPPPPPAPRAAAAATARPVRPAKRPASDEDLAFAPVHNLAQLIRTKQISSTELTRFYLARLRKYDPTLRAVISFTEELAMKQAAQADKEIAAGKIRGPLHGIPWGAKDLLAVPGYKTTWGAGPYKDQTIDVKATVVQKLEDAGAVLVAKTTLGELAQGDIWFDSRTNNPWNPRQGSSGSSAGSSSTAAAGCVGFAIGTETLGSIVSPCTRCGATGLRPTFGRVSRFGAMALSWSMDKIGPIARSVEDLGLVFRAIHGADPLDPTALDRPFAWPPRDIKSLRVGYIAALFDDARLATIQNEQARNAAREQLTLDRATLDVLRSLGVKLIPIELPSKYPVQPLRIILTAEAAAAFDVLTRSGRDSLLVQQNAGAWPNTFRQSQFIPAVEYIRANRIRTLLMQEMEKMMAEIDVYVSPAFAGDNLLLTNLTGHPAVVLPNGFRQVPANPPQQPPAGGAARPPASQPPAAATAPQQPVEMATVPTSITFQGKLFGESDLLALAMAYQNATDFHLRRPPLDKPASS